MVFLKKLNFRITNFTQFVQFKMFCSKLQLYEHENWIKHLTRLKYSIVIVREQNPILMYIMSFVQLWNFVSPIFGVLSRKQTKFRQKKCKLSGKFILRVFKMLFLIFKICFGKNHVIVQKFRAIVGNCSSILKISKSHYLDQNFLEILNFKV